MKRTFLACAGLLCGVLVGGAAGADVRVLLPLYAYPTWWDAASYVWDDVAAAGSRAPITAIINPNNGPDGGPPNADFVIGMNALRAGGVGMIGYVHTSYGARSAAEVKADIDLYSAYYGVGGIFLDEVSTATNKLAYYADLYAYIKGRTNLPLVVTNPGTKTPEVYLSFPATDTSVIFEDGEGWTTYVPDAYVARYPARCFATLLHDIATAESMRTNVDLAVRRNVGWIYVTDDTLDDPWDTLPSYWAELVDYVADYRRLEAVSAGLDTNGVVLGFSTLSNRPYRVEWNSALAGGAWNPLTATIVSTSRWVQARDAAPTGAVRTYRLRLFP